MKKQKSSYTIRCIRLSDKTWQELKDKRWKSKKSWEKFIVELLGKEKVYAKNK